jgi:dTDP-4-dehydrorhamnose 3,5-epimerase
LKFITQKISDVILIDPTLHGDSRGYFSETFRQDLFDEAVGHNVNFVQENESKSINGVLRGLHYQLAPYTQSKLVRVIQGTVLDVVVDIRQSSPSYGKHLAIELSAENRYQLFVPKGFAHGYVVLSEDATFVYKVDNYYAPEFERGVAFDDPALGIDWLVSLDNLIISIKDKSYPNLSDAPDYLT